MESSFNINEKRIKSQEVLQIIKEHKERSNRDLQIAMEFINEDHKLTKEHIIKLTHHLDALENTYNVIHKEYTERTKLK